MWKLAENISVEIDKEVYTSKYHFQNPRGVEYVVVEESGSYSFAKLTPRGWCWCDQLDKTCLELSQGLCPPGIKRSPSNTLGWQMTQILYHQKEYSEVFTSYVCMLYMLSRAEVPAVKQAAEILWPHLSEHEMGQVRALSSLFWTPG